LCCFEVDTVLRLVEFVFCLVPFDPHPYLQHSPYEAVKQNGRVGLQMNAGISASATGLRTVASAPGTVTLE
jgi:hypothetical protein